MRKVVGVDEAGRGCVIGPLVIVGVLFDEKKLKSLNLIGVKDSKRLSRKKRESLAVEIKTLASDWKHFDLQPKHIDIVVKRGLKLKKLNYLEAMAMAKVIRELNPDKVYIDPADVIADRFKKQIGRVLIPSPKIICEKHADSIYPVVSAASILAKVRRDRLINELKEKHGDFGSGYCSDPKTIGFLNSWYKKNKSLSYFIRESWATVKRIKDF